MSMKSKPGKRDAEFTIVKVSIGVTFIVCDMEFVVSSRTIFKLINERSS